MARRSPPKQNCRPAPVNTTARTAGLRLQVMAAANRSIAISRLSVLELSGRLRVTTATAPRVSTCTLEVDISQSLFVRRDRYAQTDELVRELDLTRHPVIRLVVRQLGQQLLLIGHGRRQLRHPLRVHVHMAGSTGTHDAANGRDAVDELPKSLHDFQSGLRIHLMLDPVAIDDTQ